MANILDRIAQELRPWHPTDEQFQHVAEKMGFKPDAEAVDAIKALQVRYDRAFARLNELGHAKAVDLVNEQAKTAEAICDGRKAPPPGQGFLTKGQFVERLQAEKSALKEALRGIGIAAARSARPLTAAFVAALEERAKQSELEAFGKMDEWAMPHAWRDPLAEGLRRMARAADDHLREDSQILLCKPTGFTPFIKF